MLKVMQTKFGMPDGNCVQACVASIFELPLNEVDELNDSDWWDRLTKWCSKRNCYPINNYPTSEGEIPHWFIETGAYGLGSIKSPRGDFLHCVVIKGDKIVHDPHPDQDGYDMALEDFQAFLTIDPKVGAVAQLKKEKQIAAQAFWNDTTILCNIMCLAMKDRQSISSDVDKLLCTVDTELDGTRVKALGICAELGIIPCDNVDKVVENYNKMTGVLRTYQDNYMCLSCRGEIIVRNSVITSKNFQDVPRIDGDIWVDFYTSKEIGDTVTGKEIDELLSFNGEQNIISAFCKKEPGEIK